jgi:hypothetical protein
LQTGPGTSFDFTALSGGAVGVVDFMGVSIPGTNGADTIIQRLSDATINPGVAPTGLTDAQIAALPNAIGLQVKALSLESITPVTIGPYSYNVSVTLDPANLANDTGWMAIYGNSMQVGTYVSYFDVYFEAQFVDPSYPAADFDVFSSVVLSPVDGVGYWSSTPSSHCSNDYITEVNPAGNAHHVACAISESQMATPTFAPASQDFFPTVPEPVSMLLISTGLLGLGLLKRRHS